MSDLVGTCPKDFWKEWLAEGDCAGDPETGIGWSWNTKDRKAKNIKSGDRFYVVAHGKLRGWATVIDVEEDKDSDGSTIYCIIRKGGAVACTIDAPRALRRIAKGFIVNLLPRVFSCGGQMALY